MRQSGDSGLRSPRVIVSPRPRPNEPLPPALARVSEARPPCEKVSLPLLQAYERLGLPSTARQPPQSPLLLLLLLKSGATVEVFLDDRFLFLSLSQAREFSHNEFPPRAQDQPALQQTRLQAAPIQALF